LSEEELDILKFGLKFAIKPLHLTKSQVSNTFELPHQDIKRHLVDKHRASEVGSEIQHLATTYVNSFKPSLNDSKKLKILKKLRKNKDIIILRPDKGNDVVVLDKVAYNNAISDLLSDDTKFKKIQSELTLGRELCSYNRIYISSRKTVSLILLLTVTFIPLVLNQLGYMVYLSYTKSRIPVLLLPLLDLLLYIRLTMKNAIGREHSINSQ